MRTYGVFTLKGSDSYGGIFPYALCAERATLRWPESADRDLNALTTKPRRSTASKFKSSVKALAIKLD